MPTYNKIAADCPAVQMTPYQPLAAAQPASETFSQGERLAAPKLNNNVARTNISYRYGGGRTCAVGQGLNVTASGLIATVSAGQALAGMLVQVPETHVSLQDNADNWVWLTRDGVVQVVVGNLSPPTQQMPCVLLGCVPVASGVAGETDESGVVRERGGRLRQTADNGKPGDAPGAMMYTVTKSGIYQWIGGDHVLLGGGVLASVSSVSPHNVLIGPVSGGSGPATWRALAASDLPLHNHDGQYYTKAQSDSAYGTFYTNTAAAALVTNFNALITNINDSISGIITTLQGKAAAVHTHTAAQITDFSAAVRALFVAGAGGKVSLTFDAGQGKVVVDVDQRQNLRKVTGGAYTVQSDDELLLFIPATVVSVAIGLTSTIVNLTAGDTAITLPDATSSAWYVAPSGTNQATPGRSKVLTVVNRGGITSHCYVKTGTYNPVQTIGGLASLDLGGLAAGATAKFRSDGANWYRE